MIKLTHPKTSIPLLNRLLIIWAVIRLPAIALGLYFFRDQFVSLVEQSIGLETSTERAIYFISTLPERVLIFLLCSLILGGSVFVSELNRSRLVQYFLPLLVSWVLFLSLWSILPSTSSSLKGVALSLFLTGILAVNRIPDTWFISFIASGSGRWIASFVFVFAVGISEVLLLKPFLLWLLMQLHGLHVGLTKVKRRVISWLPVVVLVPLLMALLLSSDSLVNLGQTLHRDRAVSMLAKENYNWLDLNREQKLLYASGHGTNHVRAYALGALKQAPRESRSQTGYAQGFAYNPSMQELYVYNSKTQNLLFLNANTLELIKSVRTPQVAPGDSWLVWDKFSDSIIIASEADKRQGFPFVVVNRKTGDVVNTLSLDPSYILLNPTRPLLYMNFFRRSSELMMYNTQQRQIVKKVPTDQRVDRMVFATQDNEVLVPSPLHSTVLRYDAATLNSNGDIKTLFGVRTLAVDPLRNLLLCGSLTTNLLEVIDLATHKSVAKYYVGPWIRTICLDTEAGIAYVSTKHGLFRVQYTAQLS